MMHLLIAIRLEAVHDVMALATEPAQVGGNVVTALGAQRDVMRVDSGTQLALLAGLTDVLQAEAPKHVGISSPR